MGTARSGTMRWEAANGTRLSGRALQCFIEIDCRPNATQFDTSYRGPGRFEYGARRQTDNSVFFWPNLNPPPQHPGPGSPPTRRPPAVSGFRLHTVRLVVLVGPPGPLCWRPSRIQVISALLGCSARADSSSTPSPSLSPCTWKRFRSAPRRGRRCMDAPGLRFGGSLWGSEAQARPVPLHKLPLFDPVQPLRSAIPQPKQPHHHHRPRSDPSPASPCFMLSCDRMTQTLGQLACASCFCDRFMPWRPYPWLASVALPSDHSAAPWDHLGVPS
jgi:hypothetical protein